MADNQNPQTTSNNVVNTSPASDDVQLAEEAPVVLKTTKEWDEYEAAHVARTGPPGQYFEQFIERLEAKALKEQEGREYSGDTDSDEDDEGDNDEDDDNDNDDDNDKNDTDEETLTQEEILAIHDVAAYPSGRLSPLPGTIGAELYDSDKDDSDYNPDKKVKFADDDESSTASDSSSDKTNDSEMSDIE